MSRILGNGALGSLSVEHRDDLRRVAEPALHRRVDTHGTAPAHDVVARVASALRLDDDPGMACGKIPFQRPVRPASTCTVASCTLEAA